MVISLIICTYSRADILRVTLPFILRLEIPNKIQLELIIVDNNSTDNTSIFSTEFIKQNSTKIEMYYVFEGKQGLSHARNTGYEQSNGDYVVYIDDECILPEQWLVEGVKEINESSPAFLGGPYYGKYLPGKSSSWYKESFGDSYILQYELPNGPMINRYLSGGNLFVRRDVFEKVGLFDIELGMTGDIINYGEEIDFQKRFIERYPDEIIWYDKKIFLYHLIRSEKMSMTFLFKDALIRGISSAELRKLNKKQLKYSPLHLIYFVFKALVSMFSKVLKSLVGEKKFFSLLYLDYKDGTWRDIGSAWYKVRRLVGK